MKCQNCGTDNLNGAKFCAKCGAGLEAQPMHAEGANPNIGANVNTNSSTKSSFNFKNIFKTILNAIVKPSKAFNDLKDNDYKGIAIYGGIFVGLITVLHTIMYVIYGLVGGKFKESYYSQWDFGTICKEFFSVLGYIVLFIVITAFIYKVTSMFVKKEVDFKKLLVGCIVGFTAVIVSTYIISQFYLILLAAADFFSGKFFDILFTVILDFALLYSLFYTIQFTSKNFGDNEDKGILINVLCLTIVFTISSFVLNELFSCSLIGL